MNVTLNISSSEQAKFKKQVEKFAKKSDQMLTSLVMTSAYNIMNNAKRNLTANKNRVTSALFNSIKVVMDNGKLIARVEVNKDYSTNLEFGSKSKMQVPAGVDINLKPETTFDELYQSIKLWCKRRGLPKEAAYPIARQIAKVGQEAHPFLHPAYMEEKPKFTSKLKKVFN